MRPLPTLLLLVFSAAPAGAAPVGLPHARLEVSPPAVALRGRDDAAHLLVTARLSDGRRVDVTRAVTWSRAKPVRVAADGTVTPAADGAALLVATWRGATAPVSVTVRDSARPRPVSFVREVHPVLSKGGCSQGVCHGNANGKGGLKLSLRGQDPAADWAVLVPAAGGRRVNRVDPARSLLLLKPSGGLPHLGGIRFTPASVEYRILGRWIAEGARSDLESAPPLAALEVEPAERVLYAGSLGLGASQQLRVTARYPDGSRRDVTDLACYESSDEGVAVSPSGLASAPDGGDAGVNVRFGGLMRAARLTFVPRRPAFAFHSFPVRSYVDRLTADRLRTLRLQPAPLADDATFLRRAYLDALGFPPAPEEARAALAELRAGGTAARDRLIDRLLARPEFNDVWVLKWADLLRAEERSLDPIGMRALYAWLRESFAADKPLDQLARELLTATGSTYDRPAASYFRRTRAPDLLAENTAQLFLGVRLACAKCHNHPYDRWKQTDYHGMAAYFARLTRETKHKPRRMRFDAEEFHGDEFILPAPEGEWTNPGTGQPIAPRMLDDPASAPAPDEPDRRLALARWITGPANPYFARALANRIWHHFLGRGIVDPVDDFRDSNPPSSPALLDALAADLARSGFSLRHLARTVMRSSVYQLGGEETALNAGDERNFARAYPRRLSAEQLLEAIGGATGSPEPFEGYPAGTRVAQVVPTWQPHAFLRLFGQPARETVCECERSGEPTLGQSFELIGGRLVDARLRAPENRLSRLLAGGKSPPAMVEELYLAALSRLPTADERQRTAEHLARAVDRRAALEDLTWALINTREFLMRL